jgi:hypothetical protein
LRGAGLDGLLGPPSADIAKEIENEHLSEEPFEAYNDGKTRKTR